MLKVRDAYERWAPQYDTETAVTLLENEIVGRFAIPTAGRAVLDAGCGTGRRLRLMPAALAVGIDLTFAMLARAHREAKLAVADVRALPFTEAVFDVIFCRLVLGHLQHPLEAYRELARVCRPGGAVLITDFHHAAAEAGHTRTFRDAQGQVHEIEHYVHTPYDHLAFARAHGLIVERCEHGVVGPPIRHLYVAAGRTSQYEEQCGLPLVLALVCRKSGRARI